MTDAPTSYELKINRWSPKTIPVERLAEYLALIAKLLGYPEHVHWDGIRAGSTRPAVAVDQGFRVQVQRRLALASSPDAPGDLIQAQIAVNAALRSDATDGRLVARIGLRKRATIIEFPGTRQLLPRSRTVIEHAEIDGQIIGVVGKDETISIRIQTLDGETLSCETRSRDTARALAKMLWEGRVRLTGPGKWLRSDGRWRLTELKIDHFEPIELTTLMQDVERLRAIANNPWTDAADPIEEALSIRRGR